jgi:hypothetical protein
MLASFVVLACGGGGGGSDGSGGAGTGGTLLSASTDGRRLVDASGTHVLVLGDAPQALTVNVSAAEAESYFAVRSTQGFNAAWVDVLNTTYTGGRANATTYDGISPFNATLPGGELDLRSPNAAYFARVDAMVTSAANHGITLWLDPIETGGFLSTLQANGVAANREYGRFLGRRYRDRDNIVWMSGDDYYAWTDARTDAVVLAVAQGIRDEDTRHLQTTELGALQSSLDDVRWLGLLGINQSYTYNPTYAELYDDWQREPHLPNVMIEGGYEGESCGANPCRYALWWSMLSGAAGVFYGNHWVWPFDPAWESHLHDPGAESVKHVRALLGPRRWHAMVPDIDHRVATAGYGTESPTGGAADNDYVTTARVPDGSLVVSYFPAPHDLSIDMSMLSGVTTVIWYDPTTGASTAAPLVANSGTHVFTPPSTVHADGSSDWVLVLQSGS